MQDDNILGQVKQTLEGIVPKEDERTPIGPFDFVVSLIFSYSGDTKTSSLEGIRRHLKSVTNENICRSSFWERLGTRRMEGFLETIVTALMLQLISPPLVGMELLILLGVSGILMVDSSSITLGDGAKHNFPGSRTKAGIKWHACFNLLTGVLTWFKLTPASTSDNICFPSLVGVKGKLFLFDLGYWSFKRLFEIQQAEAYFLSRIKSNTVIKIKKVISGMSKRYKGKLLLSIAFKNKRGDIIEAQGEIIYDKKPLSFRVIGFWNPSDRAYHWYITNLFASAEAMYALYRIRWQIELIFKSSKQSLNLNRLTSKNPAIIKNLILASIAACLISNTISRIGIGTLIEDQKLAISFQRIAKVAATLAREFIMYFLNSSKKYLKNLIEKILLFADELFDPNYKHRETTLAHLNKILKVLKVKAET